MEIAEEIFEGYRNGMYEVSTLVKEYGEYTVFADGSELLVDEDNVEEPVIWICGEDVFYAGEDNY